MDWLLIVTSQAFFGSRAVTGDGAELIWWRNLLPGLSCTERQRPAIKELGQGLVAGRARPKPGVRCEVYRSARSKRN